MKDGHYIVSVNKKDKHELGFIFSDKICLFQRLLMRLSSSLNVFIEFMHFSIWTIKQDRLELYNKEIDESLINVDNFINDADVVKRRSMAVLTILLHYLDDILGGYPVKDEA